jgi:hypothetical protein
MRISLIYLILSLFINSIARSQDIITWRSGGTISAKVLKVSPDNIEYDNHVLVGGLPVTITIPIPISAIAFITYQNGTRDTSPESKTDANVNHSEGVYTLEERGRLDAAMYYNGGPRAFNGGLLSGLYPFYGIISVAIIASTRPKEETLNFPYPELLDNYEYSRAYRQKAFQIKKKKAWEGFGIVTGVYATILVAALITSLTTH